MIENPSKKDIYGSQSNTRCIMFDVRDDKNRELIANYGRCNGELWTETCMLLREATIRGFQFAINNFN